MLKILWILNILCHCICPFAFRRWKLKSIQKPKQNYSQAHTSNVCAIEHIVKIVKQKQIKSEAYCDPFTCKRNFLDDHWYPHEATFKVKLAIIQTHVLTTEYKNVSYCRISWEIAVVIIELYLIHRLRPWQKQRRQQNSSNAHLIGSLLRLRSPSMPICITLPESPQTVHIEQNGTNTGYLVKTHFQKQTQNYRSKSSICVPFPLR